MDRSDLRDSVTKILDAVFNLDEQLLKEWIWEMYPHGVGLYDD